MHVWLIPALGVALAAAAQGTAPIPTPIWVPAAQALAAKAPGAPGYGLQLTTSTGKVLMTNLSFDPATRKPLARLYGIHGPAGWGPYPVRPRTMPDSSTVMAESRR